MVISVVFTALAGIFVGLRIFTRVIIIKHTGPGDWMIMLSYVSSGLYVFANIPLTNRQLCSMLLTIMIGIRTQLTWPRLMRALQLMRD